MFRVEFNYQAASTALRDASEELADMTPVYAEIGDYMVEATKDRFRKGVAPDGTPWAPKSLVTIASYRARGDGNRPDPLIGPSRRLSSEIAKLVSPDSVEIGSSLEYSAAMQNGVRKGAFGRDKRNHPIPWGDIPRRVWLGLSDQDERAIVDIADDHIFDAMGGGERE